MRLAAALVAWFMVLTSSAVAQVPPACPPATTMDVILTTQDGGQDGKLVATHESGVTADIADRTSPISNPPDHIVITPQPGVEVLKKTSDGSSILFFAPNAPNLVVTVAWQQSTNPGDLDEDTKCSASQGFTVPLLAARRATVKLLGKKLPRAAQYYVSFSVRPARRRPNMDPIELTLRRSARPRIPSSRAKALRWKVPMRPLERIRYHKRIPPLTVYLSTAKRCRFWYFSCGAVFSQVSALQPDGTISLGLPFSQPSRYSARFGIDVTTRPSGRPTQPFAFDVQARQSGRLVARYRRAGVCRDVHRSSGLYRDCRLSVLKNFPR